MVCYGGEQIQADFSRFIMDENEESATTGACTCVVEWNHTGKDHTPSALKDKIVLDGQQYLEFKAFVQKVQAPQCKRVVRDRRVEIGERLCRNKTWRASGMCYLHE
ncbi:TPA: hypothetical protein ACH3X2_001509 [Trebouxia sp. C0005]